MSLRTILDSTARFHLDKGGMVKRVEKISHLVSTSLRMFVVCIAVLAIGHTAFSQLPTATISGVVRDTSGAVVPDATLTAKDLETGQARTVVSAGDGTYRFADLPVGPYELRAEHSGFETQVRSGMTLTVSEEAVVNFSIAVGSTRQVVTVSGEPSLVNVTNGALGGLVNDKKMADLPLNGRNYIDLSQMQPGVTRNTNVGTAQGMAGTWFSSNGAPLRSNTYQLDGASFVNFFGGGPSSISGSTLGVEGIREFRILTNSYGAEYGMTMGSQTVMVSKSGTNVLHGAAFEYLRNSALDAANYFDTPASSGGRRLPELHRNNFGGSLGGPIKKNDTFIFGAYEGLREIEGATVISTVPAPGCHGAAGATITNTDCPQLGSTSFLQIAPVVAPLLTVFPNPNLPNDQFTFPLSLPDTENYGQIRVDQAISQNNKLFGRYTIIDSQIAAQVPYPNTSNPSGSRQQNLALGDDHIFSPNLLNSFRLTYNRSPRLNTQTVPYSGPGFTFIPGTSYPMGGLTVSGLTATLAPKLSQTALNLYSLGDDVFLTRGQHSLKLGTLMNMDRFNVVQGTALWGDAIFPSMARFLEGQPSSYNALTPGSIYARHWRMYTYGFYVQDDWRMRSNFTVNLGLRYEFTTQIHEENGYSSGIPNLATDTGVTVGIPFRRPTPDNFSPRLGFAWDVRGNGKTAVRGGAGILYDMLTNFGNGYSDLASGSPPFSSSVTVSNPTTFTIPFFLPSTAESSAIHVFEYHFRQPKLLSYSLTVDQQLPFDMDATLSYTGTHGMDLMQITEGNPAIPQGIPQNGTCVARPAGQPVNLTSQFDNGGATSCWLANNPRRNPHFGTIQLDQSEGDSEYNSLQFSLVKRLTHGLQFQSSYTWSHLIDNRNGVAFAEGGTNGNYGVDPLVPSVDRANADYDIRQVYRFNAIWNLPHFTPGMKFAGKFVDGWWMSGILSAQTGLPFTVVLGSNRSRSLNGGATAGLDRPNLVAGRTPGNITHGVSTPNGVDSCPTAGQRLGTAALFFDPCAFTIPAAGFLGTTGRNSLTAPDYTNLDYSLVKDTRIESLKNLTVQFRAELFNIFNHPNFAIPTNTTYSAVQNVEAPVSSAGVITSTSINTSRQIQFALKVLF